VSRLQRYVAVALLGFIALLALLSLDDPTTEQPDQRTPVEQVDDG